MARLAISTCLLFIGLVSSSAFGENFERILVIQQAAVKNLERKVEAQEKLIGSLMSQLAASKDAADRKFVVQEQSIEKLNSELASSVARVQNLEAFDASLSNGSRSLWLQNVKVVNDITGHHLYIDDGSFRINSPAKTISGASKIETWDLQAGHVYGTMHPK
ncbi:MAG TPA: hypothetical protein VE954_16470 [Oligoflexus sp.]|uniref:hypothetical protein n=1 Tax=Oligoflexus sp. TaxID=1971216 RepID=UPI002D63E15C|nr:hypothetical protein [Oligoflexus sp.]HYX34694.1 hypothetical protein [Oligoflexus sp.]